MGKILVVAEKPAAGIDIAKMLGCTKKEQGYIEGDHYIVTWALGHLVGLKDPQEHDEALKFWETKTLPFRFPIQSALKVLPSTAKQFAVIKSLIHRTDVDSLINAGDAGREGYLIQEWIYRLAGNKKPVKVLWASSLTETALKKAFDALHERQEFQNLLQEAEARAELDWLMGMNYSRGLTMTKGQGKLLRYGRCQTPLLNLIVKRDKEIEGFKPTAYYEVWRVYEEGFAGFLKGEDGKAATFGSIEEADAVIHEDQSVVLAVEEYKKDIKKVSAPSLYNLADLQKDMGSRYGYDAEKTLGIAQSLYETHKILSYPRTDSRVMSTDLAAELPAHLECLLPLLSHGEEYREYMGCEKFASIIPSAVKQIQQNKKYVNDMKVTDHHALVPAINNEILSICRKLNQDERNVFSAVVKRMLAIFLPEYTYITIELTAVSLKRKSYISNGKTVIDLGWRELYNMNHEGDCSIEDGGSEKEENAAISSHIQQGTVLNTERHFRKDKMTQAPLCYTVSSIISLMEKYGIGTSATRADIIKKLMKTDSQYLNLIKNKYCSTDLGKEYIRLIPEEIKAEALTVIVEDKLKQIGEGRLTKDQFLNEEYNQISVNIKRIQVSKDVLDTTLFKNSNKGNKSDMALKCPKCGEPVYKGKYGWYCSGYKEGCKLSIPLNVAHKALTESQVKQLLEKGKTGKVKGLKKKNGDAFEAVLVLVGDNKIQFSSQKERKGQ